MIGSFVATRSFALRDLGFSSNSFSLGRIGFFVSILTIGFLPHTQTGKSRGQMQGFASSDKVFFTILSSPDWKEIIASFPPGVSFSAAPRTAGEMASSSRLTSIRIA